MIFNTFAPIKITVIYHTFRYELHSIRQNTIN